jgi:dolichol kinase
MNNILHKPVRYLWHLLGGLFLPLVYYFMDRKISLFIFGSFFIFFFSADFVRLHCFKFNEWVFKYLKIMAKTEEKVHFSGNSYYLLGAFLAVLLFDKGIAIAGLSFLPCGDLAASIVGKRYGRIKIRKKTLEGTLAFLLACLLVGIVLLVLKLELSFGVLLIGAVTAAIVELFSPGLKDNLTIPLFGGIAMQIMKII